MAIYKVQGPDGVQHELEGPDGATDEQILAVAQQTFAKATPDQVPANDPTTGIMPAADQAKLTPEQQINYDRGGWEEGATEPEEMRALRHVNELGQGVGAAQLALGVTKGVAGMAANTEMVGGIRNKLAAWFEKKAAEQAAKAGNAGSAAVEALGTEGVRDYGRMLMKKDIAKAYRTPEEMNAAIQPQLMEAGKKIGEARNAGDLRSIAQGAERPRILDIENDLQKTLGPKYNTGLESGQKGELDNVIEELHKLAPVEKSTTGEEVVQGIKNRFGKPGERPYYYEDVRATDELGRLQPGSPETVGMQTGPQSFGPGSATPPPVGGPAPVEATPYLHDQPTFTELFDMSTGMNTAAKNAKAIQRPAGALTDAADVLSHKSTEGLENFLDPAEQAGYKVAKKDWGDLSLADQLTSGGEAKAFANTNSLPVSKFGALSRVINSVAPHSAIMSLNKKIEMILQTEPAAFGKYAKVLGDAVKRGGSALASTTFVLQQQDPEFQEAVKELNDNVR